MLLSYNNSHIKTCQKYVDSTEQNRLAAAAARSAIGDESTVHRLDFDLGLHRLAADGSGSGDYLLTGRRYHIPTSRFPPSPTPVVITEPFPDRTGPLLHVSKEMGSDPADIEMRDRVDIQTNETMSHR